MAMCRFAPARVLYVAYAAPTPSRLGPARRHYYILDQLSRFYDVHLVSLGEPADADVCARCFGDRVRQLSFASKTGGTGRKFARKLGRTLAGRCDFLPVLEPGLRRLCSTVTSTRSFDAIFLSGVLLRGLPLPNDVPLIADTHNVEFDVLRRTAALSDSVLLRQYARRQWRATRREEQRCGRGVDLLLATSERDRFIFERELQISHSAVIPNGIDLTEFASPYLAPEAGTLVFSGLMSYYPNQQAVRWFLDAVFPLVLRQAPAARFVVAGASPPAWLRARASSRVDVTGEVPAVQPYLERAQVVVVPLMIGGGTRIKVLEALAAGRPVVSTSIGAEGLDLPDGESILIADDAQSFADRVVQLLSSPSLAAQIVDSGRRHVVHRFDWNRIGERLRDVLETRIGLSARAHAGGRREAAAMRAQVAES